MLKPEHFDNCEIHLYTKDIGVYEFNSTDVLDHLEHEHIDGMHHIGLLDRKVFNADYERIILDYYHLEPAIPDNWPPEHHMGTFRLIWSGPDKTCLICQHSLSVQQPNAELLKLLYDMGNAEVKSGLYGYIRSATYLDIKRMSREQATWFMAIILGGLND